MESDDKSTNLRIKDNDNYEKHSKVNHFFGSPSKSSKITFMLIRINRIIT